jgi:hypothetical protein
MIKNQTDFKLLDKKVVDSYCALPEHERFFRGLIEWMRYPSIWIPFDAPERRNSRSRWAKLRLFSLTVSAITGFSTIPMYLIFAAACLMGLTSVIFGGIALIQKISGAAGAGFTTLILLVLFVGSVISFSIGIVGIYQAKIFKEVKKRPPYLKKSDSD